MKYRIDKLLAILIKKKREGSNNKIIKKTCYSRYYRNIKNPRDYYEQFSNKLESVD